MDKTKIYCMGCPELPKVLQEIASEGHARLSLPSYQASQEDIAIGCSPYSTSIAQIGWTTNEGFYKRLGYKKVSVEEFREAWLGTKKVIGYSGCPELKKLVDKLEKEFVFTRKHIGTNNCHFTFIKKEDGTYSFEYIDSDLVLPDVNLARFEDFWRKELPKKKVDAPKKKYIGFEGGDIPIELLPMGIKHPVSFKKGIIYYLDKDQLLQAEKNWPFCDEEIEVLEFSEFVVRILENNLLKTPEIRKFENFVKTYCVPVMNPNKLAQIVIKPCIPESSEEKLSLPPKKSIKIVL